LANHRRYCIGCRLAAIGMLQFKKQGLCAILGGRAPCLGCARSNGWNPGWDRPGRLEGELVVITATVKAIDKKNRVVTLQSPDGKVAKVKCGPEVRNFAQIRVGDEVKTSLLETVELFVTGNDEPLRNG